MREIPMVYANLNLKKIIIVPESQILVLHVGFFYA